MNWLRLHHSVLSNHKVQSLPPNQFKFWVNLMIVASENTPRGTLPSIEQVAYKLHLRVDQAGSNVEAMVMQGLCERDQGVIRMHDWDDHQPLNDDSSERVRRYRERQRNGDVTVTVTPQIRVDRDKTREEQNREEKTSPTPPSSGECVSDLSNLAKAVKPPDLRLDWFQEFWLHYPRHDQSKPAREAFLKHVRDQQTFAAVMDGLRRHLPSLVSKERQFQPLPATWINKHIWEDEPPPVQLPGSNGTTPRYQSPGGRAAAFFLSEIAKAEAEEAAEKAGKIQ